MDYIKFRICISMLKVTIRKLNILQIKMILIISNILYIEFFRARLAERSDTKSNVKLDGFRSWLQSSYVSSHTEES